MHQEDFEDFFKNHLSLSLFKDSRHVPFLRSLLWKPPREMLSMDTNRLTLVFFCVAGLDLLSRKPCQYLDAEERSQIIEWIYSMQLNCHKCQGPGRYGFRGSNSCGADHSYDFGSLAMTYSALASLIILGDDLSRVNSNSLKIGLKELQLDSGSFSVSLGSEADMRFVYCASVICFLLDDWSMMDMDRTIHYIRNSLSYEGAFGQGPGHEAHGGSTYCAVASLVLMGKLECVLSEKGVRNLRRWCIMKQERGFMGRPNKEMDTCYSFWIGATLHILGSFELVNSEENIDFVRSTEDARTGGFGKHPSVYADPLHTFLGLSGLSLHHELQQVLKAIDPTLNISRESLRDAQGRRDTSTSSSK